jgi:outer membrane receptor for ferric coprogen and ferric-rhodotorulic acid
VPGDRRRPSRQAIRDGDQNRYPDSKTPQSISVVTAEEMALHQPRSVKEALSYTPGVAVARAVRLIPMTI